MIEKLDILKENEKQELMDALPLITLLIAGSDGQIRDEELVKSEKITHIRGYNEDVELHEFYALVEENYHDRLNRWLKALPKDVDARTVDLSQRLARLNKILAKLDKETGVAFYNSFKSFAKHIAKASGGILGWGSISKEEAKWIDLPMLDPIEMGSEE